MYVYALAIRAMNLQIVKACFEQLHRSGEDYLGLPSLETQESVLDTPSPFRSPGDVPDAVVSDDVVVAVLDFDEDWNLEGAVGED